MLRETKFEITYSSGENEPVEFYSKALLNSTHFDLALGYFSTSGFRMLSLGFAHFISNGGTARIIFNNILSRKDKDIITGLSIDESEELIQQRVISNFDSLFKALNSYDKHFFKCLSYLIASDRLQLRSVVPSDNEVGIAHNKFCIFVDSKNDFVVSNGSANFSENAFLNNSEVIDCFACWDLTGRDSLRAKEYRTRFEDIWTNRHKKLRIIDLEEVKVRISNQFPTQTIDGLLDEQQKLLDALSDKKSLPDKIIGQLQTSLSLSKVAPSLPHIPEGMDPHRYQNKAVSNWFDNGCQGLFEMATGTGKTFTAILGATKLLEKRRRLIIHIVAPTISLVKQWVEELNKWNYRDIIVASGEDQSWETKALSTYNNYSLQSIDQFVIVSTYASFGMNKLQEIIGRKGDETLLIADECHYLGANNLQTKIPLNIRYRIGLSATPHRHFDETGTNVLLTFFNSPKKSTYTLDIGEAISLGFLCDYELYPHVVELTETEYDKYREISLKIVKLMGGNKDTKAMYQNKSIEKWLIKRKNIVNQADNKLRVVGEIIDKILTHAEEVQYTLVYCPEGGKDGNAEITKYNKYLAFDKGLRVNVFTGQTPPQEREMLLDQFASGSIQCLLAMKCLDEGIDVKRTETAIFVASSTNPRQYIQRRGRILRTHKEKAFAKIHDILVVPPFSQDPATAWLEKSLLSNEIKRFQEFASEAVNYPTCKIFIDRLKEKYGVEDDEP
jgi:superfamily II DNA or RNA helicase